MTTNSIVSQPKSQELLSQIFLDHQVVSIAAELIIEMLKPDKIASMVENHWSWIGDLPSFRSDEVEVISGSTLRCPLEEVHIRYFGLCRIELPYWIRATRTLVKGLIISRLEDGFLWWRQFLGNACREMPKQGSEDKAADHAIAAGHGWIIHAT